MRARSQTMCKVSRFSLGDESKRHGKGRKMDRMESCIFKKTVHRRAKSMRVKKKGVEKLVATARGEGGRAMHAIPLSGTHLPWRIVSASSP